MLLMKKAIILILCGISLTLTHAQSSGEIFSMRQLMPVSAKQKAYYLDYAEKNRTEWDVVASGMFLFYKNFISSQDGNRCSFHPSCSEFAVQIIRKKGWFIGTMSTFDRLMRCNSLSPEWYEIDYGRKLLVDEP